MLSGITSYLFGGNNADDYNQAEAEKPRCRLRTRHDENEWLIVEPSSRGASPENVQPHPMENLLIEHPSMSVYGPRGRPASADLESDASESSAEGSPPVRPSTSRPTRAVVSRPPRRAHAIAARAGILAQAQSARALQRAQVKHNKRKLSRNSFARGNRLVEISVAKQPRNRQIVQPVCKGGNRRQ